ncbi:hypothetical protein DEU56DRAFT_524091 [Suillus clintonianus]|uniref:uncharacterized protein n=1 Tax=Suillus clintonianus TaxID=1904413 RepID=UPI001B86928F|nr:uncharacterized protein DEU56DRAFT_524091 [Suillus clintonianus]KAG2127964.1 hypothetical protein DEU56DRAFT_524091 [Suillus clintonianus]
MDKEYYSRYSPVDGANDDDDGAKLLDSTETRLPSTSRFLHLWPWLSYSVLMSTTMLFFMLWVQAPSIDDLVPYSPANEAIESIGIIRLNGSFGATSIYRGTPNPELEAAWEAISIDAGAVRIMPDELLRSGEKPSPSMVRYPDEYGGGYMATITAIHMLHCTNILRRASRGDYYRSSDYSLHGSPEIWRTNLDHCIEMLRQNIMCRGDVSMVTYDWVEDDELPTPNFDVPHQCRNFEKILDWVEENRVILPQSKMVRSEDTIDLLSPP